MTVLAANFPFLVHVFGAMVLVGALVTAVLFGLATWRSAEPGGAADGARRTFRTLLFVAFPAWWVMRIGAQWVYSEQGWEDVPGDEPAWLGVGFITSEAGGLLLLIGIILSGIGARRLRQTESGSGLVRATTVLVSIALLAYVVAVWAMSGKPS